MTRTEAIRTLVLELSQTKDPDEIAAILRIPVTRVDRILDDQDAREGVPHPERARAPILEPLGGPAVVTSQAASSGGKSTDPTAPKGPKRVKAVKPPTPEPPPPAPPAERGPIVCGTMRGYRKHRRNREKPCVPCYAAYNEIEREGRKPRLNVHGTPEGFLMHLRNKQRPCEQCEPHGRPSREVRRDQRMDLHRQGLTDVQIARTLDVATSVIRKWRQRMNLPPNRAAS